MHHPDLTLSRSFSGKALIANSFVLRSCQLIAQNTYPGIEWIGGKLACSGLASQSQCEVKWSTTKCSQGTTRWQTTRLKIHAGLYKVSVYEIPTQSRHPVWMAALLRSQCIMWSSIWWDTFLRRLVFHSQLVPNIRPKSKIRGNHFCQEIPESWTCFFTQGLTVTEVGLQQVHILVRGLRYNELVCS